MPVAAHLNMITTESTENSDIEAIVERVVQRQQAAADEKERELRRQRKSARRRRERRQMVRSVEVIKWCMIGSVALSSLSMCGVLWTAYQANRTVNLVEREITEFRQTVYHPVENAAAALGKQIDDKIEAYFQENPSSSQQ